VAYRYRMGGRGSKRAQRGGFASERVAAEALERELERLRREQRVSRSLTLRELVEAYLEQHDVEPVTIENLHWLLGKAVAAFGERPVGELRSQTDSNVDPFLPSHVADARFGENARVPAYTVNQDAVRDAKRLIDAHQYVLRSRWQDVQPRAREQNAFLKTHSWEEYAAWHLGLTEGAAEETKARYAFVYGDFRRLHRMGLIACHYRAAEWRHKEIELAAHELL
jgi:hypothetical protein